MYFKNISLRNFHTFDARKIELKKKMTVFVGEKRNAIDAIRLLTSPLGGRHEI